MIGGGAAGRRDSAATLVLLRRALTGVATSTRGRHDRRVTGLRRLRLVDDRALVLRVSRILRHLVRRVLVATVVTVGVVLAVLSLRRAEDELASVGLDEIRQRPRVLVTQHARGRDRDRRSLRHRPARTRHGVTVTTPGAGVTDLTDLDDRGGRLGAVGSGPGDLHTGRVDPEHVTLLHATRSVGEVHLATAQVGTRDVRRRSEQLDADEAVALQHLPVLRCRHVLAHVGPVGLRTLAVTVDEGDELLLRDDRLGGNAVRPTLDAHGSDDAEAELRTLPAVACQPLADGDTLSGGTARGVRARNVVGGDRSGGSAALRLAVAGRVVAHDDRDDRDHRQDHSHDGCDTDSATRGVRHVSRPPQIDWGRHLR